jgi:hypothetical protein
MYLDSELLHYGGKALSMVGVGGYSMFADSRYTSRI